MLGEEEVIECDDDEDDVGVPVVNQDGAVVRTLRRRNASAPSRLADIVPMVAERRASTDGGKEPIAWTRAQLQALYEGLSCFGYGREAAVRAKYTVLQPHSYAEARR